MANVLNVMLNKEENWIWIIINYNNLKMELESSIICNECKAIRVREKKPEIWLKYNFLTKRLYKSFTDGRGLSYCNCPRCSSRIRKANGL